MPRADFTVVPFHHNFSAQDNSTTRSFNIEGVLLENPVDQLNEAYLLIQTKGVSTDSTEISINGLNLGGTFDIPLLPGNEDTWVLTLRHLNPGILTTGGNSIRITRIFNDNDDFRIGNVIVNWREE